jgi:hypothetical protein
MSHQLYGVFSSGILFDFLVEYVDRPLRRVRNRDVKPDMVVLSDLADPLKVFLVQRDLLKVLDDTAFSLLKVWVECHSDRSLTLIHRLGDHGVASRHSPSNEHLRSGRSEPLRHFVHFGIVYQLSLALHCSCFQHSVHITAPRFHSRLFPSGE